MNSKMGHPNANDNAARSTVPPPKKGWMRKLLQSDKNEWLKDMRGNLILVATVISTMTFQVALNPPGGFRGSVEDGIVDCTDDMTPCPGEAVLAVVYPDDYFKFLLWNTISFVASLSVSLLLVSGLPLNHRFPMWLLSIGMCLTLTSLALTYLFAAKMVTPDPVWYKANSISKMVLIIWFVLVGLVGLFLTIRFVTWLVKKFTYKCNRETSQVNPSYN